MAINPQDIYSIVADPTMSPDDKRARINMLYAPPAIAMPGAMPDVRTASVDPNSIMAGSGALNEMPPTPGPMMSDAGGMSVAPPVSISPPVAVPQPSPGAISSMAASMPATPPPPPGTNMSSTSGGAVAAPPPVVRTPAHETRGEGAPVTPDSRSDQDMLDAGAQAVIGAAFRGSAAHRVAAHDQPTASVIERAGGVPEEYKERLATDAQAEAGLALDAGDQAAEAHDKAAKMFQGQAVNAKADQTALELKNQFQQEHVQKMDQHFGELVKDTALRPNEWWAAKDTGHKVISFISALMFGLAQDPAGLDKVINDDMALRQQNREKKLGAYKARIDTFKSQLMSPEAAHAAERALSSQAAAAEANRLTEAAQSPEAKAKGQAVAQHFQTQFDQWAAEMAQHEAGSIRTNIAHVPDRVVGGAPDPIARIKQLKEAGLSPEEILRVIGGGKYNGAAGADDSERQVILPGGQVGYTSKDLHAETQKDVSALDRLQGNLGRIKGLVGSAGHTIAGQAKEQLRAVVADTTMQLTAMASSEGANKKVAGEMLEKLEALTGSGALETGKFDSTAIAGINEAARIYGSHLEGIKGRLTPKVNTKPSGGKIQTLGAPDDLEVKPSE